MLNVTDDPEKYNKLINEHMAGLPITIVMPRLLRLIFALLEALDGHGENTYKLLGKILERLEK